MEMGGIFFKNLELSPPPLQLGSGEYPNMDFFSGPYFPAFGLNTDTIQDTSHVVEQYVNCDLQILGKNTYF